MMKNNQENKPKLESALDSDQKAQQELQKQIEEKSAKIAVILQEEPKMALQPFMHINQFGIKPDVALVRIPEKDTESNEKPDEQPLEETKKETKEETKEK